MSDIDYEENNKQPLLGDVNWEMFGICTFAMLIALLGLVNFQAAGEYYFGLVFFLCGEIIGLKIKNFGLIFLASHGITGLSLLTSSQLSGLITSPLMEDLPKSAYFVLAAILILFVAGVLTTVLYNLSDNLKKKKGAILIPLFIFFIAILIVVLCPRIYGFEVSGMFM